MKDKIERELRFLYEKYARVLLEKQELEIEIRIRNGLLLALKEEDEVKDE